MNATQQRDQACRLAKQDTYEALARARQIQKPWFKAQALSWIARFTDGSPIGIAHEAMKAAKEGDDDYKKTAVRAWEIAALAERGRQPEARQALAEALTSSSSIAPLPSAAEALTLLLHASFRLERKDVELVAAQLKTTCGDSSHWRCTRALGDADKLLSGKLEPRTFFW